MSTGKLTIKAEVAETVTRGGSLDATRRTGFKLNGLRLGECVANYRVSVANLATAGTTSIDLSTGDVTENGATSTDEGVNTEGKDLGTITTLRMITIQAPASNTVSVSFSSELFGGTLNPGAGVLLWVPEGYDVSAMGSGVMGLIPASATAGQGVIVQAFNDIA